MNDKDEMAVEMLRLLLSTSQHWNHPVQEKQEWYWDDMTSACRVAYRLAAAMREAKYSMRDEDRE